MLRSWVIWVSILAVPGAAALTYALYDDSDESPAGTSSVEIRDGLARRMRVGDLRMDAGDYAGALEAHREGLRLAERGAAGDPDSPTWKHDQAILHFRLSYSLKQLGDLDGAREHARTCATLYESLADVEPQWREELEQLRAWFEELGNAGG